MVDHTNQVNRAGITPKVAIGKPRMVVTGIHHQLIPLHGKVEVNMNKVGKDNGEITSGKKVNGKMESLNREQRQHGNKKI